MKKNLIILSNAVPGSKIHFEDWLKDEITLTHSNYNEILIFPKKYENITTKLPNNCMVVDYNNSPKKRLNFFELIYSLNIVLTDFFAFRSILKFLKSFRFNFALIKSLHINAKKISSLSIINKNTIIYAYWAGELATTACIIKGFYTDCKVVTRGHGFEIFEEQTLDNFIPFRKFQYKFLDKLFADSIKGLNHLNLKNKYSHINDISYVGTVDNGVGSFNSNQIFTIVTCSFVRAIKRLDLMINILKELKFELVWHLIGDGPDLERIKNINKNLPSNISVVYHGQKSRAEILEFYRLNHINLFVSLSSSEGLPVSMIEAISHGIPLMSTDVGGCNEICNEFTGFLIPKNIDYSKIGNKIKEFKNSEKNTLSFRFGCRRFWQKNFDADKNYNDFSNKLMTL